MWNSAFSNAPTLEGLSKRESVVVHLSREHGLIKRWATVQIRSFNFDYNFKKEIESNGFHLLSNIDFLQAISKLNFQECRENELMPYLIKKMAPCFSDLNFVIKALRVPRVGNFILLGAPDNIINDPNFHLLTLLHHGSDSYITNIAYKISIDNSEVQNWKMGVAYLNETQKTNWASKLENKILSDNSKLEG